MTVGTGYPTEGTSYAESTTGTDWTATAFTVGGMFYYGADADNFGLLFEIENGGTAVLELFVDTNFLVLKNSAQGVTSSPGTITQGNWYLMIISKAAGSATPVFHYTTDGTNWTHGNGDNALNDFTFTQSRISFAAERIGNVTAKGLKCEVATWGLWAETTDNATSVTYTSYTTLAAKANAKFFTAESLINGGSWTDTANSNNETGGNHSAGAQTVPSWFTGFGGGPVPPTPISFHASGGRSAGGTTSLSITYPTVSAGDFILMERTVKPNTATSTTPVSGFTAGINDTGGAAGDAQGADTGQTRETTEYKIASGSETGTVSTTQAGTPSSACGFMLSYSKATDTLWSIQSASADDSSHGTARSHSFGNFDLQPGDMLVVVGASDTDTTTAYTSPTFTASGITFGTVTNRLATGGVTTGNDCGNWAYEALVSTGVSTSVAVSFALTGGPSSCGRAHLYRLRQVRGLHYGRETFRPARLVPILARRRR